MNPFPWGPAGFMGGASILGGILGSMGQGGQMRNFANYANSNYNPQMLMGFYNQLLPMLQGSPMGAMQNRMALGSAGGAQNHIAMQLASRGLGGSGMGILSSGVGHSLAGNYLGQVQQGFSQQAMQQAMQLLQGRGQMMGGFQPRNYMGDMGAGFLASMGPLLNHWYNQGQAK